MNRLESVALPLFRMGHIPMIGEWVALPLLHLAGSKKPGDAAFERNSIPGCTQTTYEVRCCPSPRRSIQRYR